MIDEDLALLDIDTAYASPLDQLDQPEEELPPPDPEEMLALLDSDNVLERMQAARAFCEIEDARAIPKLIQLLQEDCALVRVSAAYAIGRNPSKSVVPCLIEQLNRDWNGYVRKGVVWALGTCKDPLALQPLISALKFDITSVRLWSASALGQLGDLRAIEPLTLALQTDKAEAVRSNSAWALGKLLIQLRSDYITANNEAYEDIYQDAVDALIDALGDDDLGIQEDARAALRKLGDSRGLSVLDKIDFERGYCDLVY